MAKVGAVFDLSADPSRRQSSPRENVPCWRSRSHTDTAPRWRSLEDDTQCASSPTAATFPDFADTSLVITPISLSCVSPSGVTRCLSQGANLAEQTHQPTLRKKMKMMVNPDVYGYAKTLNHRKTSKNIRKTQKYNNRLKTKRIQKPKYKLSAASGGRFLHLACLPASHSQATGVSGSAFEFYA